MEITKRASGGTIVKARNYLCFFLVFFVLNIPVFTVLVPNPTNYDVMLKHYSEKERIDTIFIGTSLAMCAADPEAFDTISGGMSYNMASNNQSLDTGLECIKKATVDHNIKRVILVLDEDIMGWGDDMKYSEKSQFIDSFLKRYPREGIPLWLKNIGNPRTIETAISVKSIIPWIYGKSLGRIPYRMMCLFGIIEDPELYDIWCRDENGFAHSDEASLIRETDETSVSEEPIYITDENLDMLEDMVGFSERNNIDFFVVTIPTVNSVSNNNNRYSAIQNAVEQGGGFFINCDMINKDHLNMTGEDFRDGRHMNDNGARTFSMFLASLCKEAAEGGNVMALYGEDQ